MHGSDFEKSVGDPVVGAQRVATAEDRLRSLLAAYRSVTENLDLDSVLRRIVEAAAALVHAEYCALGVVGADGRLERFIHVGMDPADVEAVGLMPEGHGLLGAVIERAETIRLPHLQEDPRFEGFPEHHPPMDAFLGVPVRAHDDVYGNLYLANPEGGEFTAEDAELIESLAATAGIAVDNARLYAAARRQQRLATALSDVSAALLAPGSADALGVIAEHVHSVVPADLITIVVPEPNREEVRVAVARGPLAADLAGARFPAAPSLAARAMTTGTIATDNDERVLFGGRLHVGATAAVPLVASGRAIGALCVARRPGAPPFSQAELETVTEFSAQAGIALALAWARRDRQRLDVIEDRARIARDLHDHVIQRLFATGLSLQALAAADPVHAAQLEEHVAELDAAITQIRTAIFTLRVRPSSSAVTPRHRLLDAITDLTPTLASAPRVAFKGPIDLVLADDLADDVVAVVRESLANIARHAGAQQAVVAVTVSDHDVTVTVDDDGVGIPPRTTRTGGTANLAARAAHHHGSYTLEPGPEGGTRAQWRVPIPRASGTPGTPAV